MATHYTQDPYYGKTIKMIDDDIHLFCSQPNCCSISATCNTTHLRDFILARGGIVEGVPLWDAWGETKPSRVHRWFARYVTMNLLNDSLTGDHNVADAATFEEIKDRVFTQFWPFIINANRYLRFLDGTIEDPPSPLISSRLHSTDSISAYTLSSSP